MNLLHSISFVYDVKEKHLLGQISDKLLSKWMNELQVLYPDFQLFLWDLSKMCMVTEAL